MGERPNIFIHAAEPLRIGHVRQTPFVVDATTKERRAEARQALDEFAAEERAKLERRIAAVEHAFTADEELEALRERTAKMERLYEKRLEIAEAALTQITQERGEGAVTAHMRAQIALIEISKVTA